MFRNTVGKLRFDFRQRGCGLGLQLRWHISQSVNDVRELFHRHIGDVLRDFFNVNFAVDFVWPFGVQNAGNAVWIVQSVFAKGHQFAGFFVKRRICVQVGHHVFINRGLQFSVKVGILAIIIFIQEFAEIFGCFGVGWQ